VMGVGLGERIYSLYSLKIIMSIENPYKTWMCVCVPRTPFGGDVATVQWAAEMVHGRMYSFWELCMPGLGKIQNILYWFFRLHEC